MYSLLLLMKLNSLQLRFLRYASMLGIRHILIKKDQL